MKNAVTNREGRMDGKPTRGRRRVQTLEDEVTKRTVEDESGGTNKALK